MWNHKLVFWLFQSNQSQTFASYLEKQAAKGWYLNASSSLPWLFLAFRKGQPDRRQYSVVLFPNASRWDGGNDEPFAGYRDLCEESGWNYEGGHGYFRIFSNPDSNAVSVETDKKLQFDAMRQALLFRQFPCYLMVLLALILMVIFTLRNAVDFVMSNYRILFTAGTLFAVLVLMTILLIQWIWYVRADRAIKRNLSYLPDSMKQVQIKTFCLYFTFVSYILFIQSHINGLFRWEFLLFSLMWDLILLSIAWMIDRAVRKKKFDVGEDYTNRYHQYGALAILLILTLEGSALKLFFPPQIQTENLAAVETGFNYPIEFQEFGYVIDPNYHIYNEKSVLAKRQGGRYSDQLLQDTAKGVSVQYYTTYQNWAYRLLHSQMKAYKGNAYDCQGPVIWTVGNVTVEAYEYHIDHEGFQGEPDYYLYVVSNGNSILKLDFAVEANEAVVQAAIAGMQRK